LGGIYLHHLGGFFQGVDSGPGAAADIREGPFAVEGKLL
jgi:hypothetical protein